MELNGTVALVTGGSGDLGAAIARALAKEGVSVAVSYVGQRERAGQVAADIEAAVCRAWTIQLDEANPAMPDMVIDEVVTRFGQLDILVNNAAWNIGIPFWRSGCADI